MFSTQEIRRKWTGNGKNDDFLERIDMKYNRLKQLISEKIVNVWCSLLVVQVFFALSLSCQNTYGLLGQM